MGLEDEIRAALRELADPAKAEPMRAYLKSAMPYLGVQLPALRKAVRPLVPRDLPPPGWRAVVLALWRGAEFREERYAALVVARRHPDHLLADVPGSVALVDELVVTGAWWDLVDETATHLLGPLLRARPSAVGEVVRVWAKDADRWRRRSAVICQVGAKAETDPELLAYVVGANAADPDFFLRKGIGWALRDYARTDPDWVRGFVAAHELSPLSRREALKHL